MSPGHGRSRTDGLRVLFVMPNPAYLRIYGSTIRLLAQRGFEVVLCYDNPKKLREGAALSAEAVEGVTVVDPIPWLDTPWKPLIRHLRLGGDYARYLDPRFADAPELRRRMDKYVPPRLDFLKHSDGISLRQAKFLVRALQSFERVIPSDPAIEGYIRLLRPDCIVITPVVARGEGGVRQAEIVKSARKLGVPVGVAITSWDHLTSKGLIKGDPDRVFLWNRAQRREAIDFHGVRSSSIVITGAQLFDQWFQREPEVSRDTFVRQVGLPADLPYIVFVGSSPNIAPPDTEVEFFRTWLEAIRTSDDPTLREIGVLVRPHPGNYPQWQRADLGGSSDVALSPRARPSLPMTADEEAHYFHSLYFSAGVVGINTSALIEAAIVGKTVHTVRAAEFRETQQGTLHFRHLTPPGGGCLCVSDDLSQHVAQLLTTLRDPSQNHAAIVDFVHSFVRPNGLEKAATPILVDAIERLAASEVRPVISPLWLAPVRGFARLVAGWLARTDGVRSRLGNPDDFTYPLPRLELYRRVARRYRKVLKTVVSSPLRRRSREQNVVADIYEKAYKPDNKTYARSRDRRRDVFMLRGRPVHTDGWYTIRFHLDILLGVLENLDVDSVLEVGSGRGTNVALLAMRRPDLHFSGIELTKNGVTNSVKLAKRPTKQHLRAAGIKSLTEEQSEALRRTEFRQASALEMPFEANSFDVAFTCLVLEQLPEKYPQILREMHRVTRKYCAFIEPFANANGPLGRAYLGSLDYFRARYEEFAKYGLEPVYFTTDIPQKVHFRTGLLLARTTDTDASRALHPRDARPHDLQRSIH